MDQADENSQAQASCRSTPFPICSRQSVFQKFVIHLLTDKWIFINNGKHESTFILPTFFTPIMENCTLLFQLTPERLPSQPDGLPDK